MERIGVSYRMQELTKVQADNAEKDTVIRPFKDLLPDGDDMAVEVEPYLIRQGEAI